MANVAEKYGYDMKGLRARQFHIKDFYFSSESVFAS